MIIKKSISDAKFKQLLFKECSKADSNGHLKSNFYEHLRTKYKIEKQRCLKLHDIYYPEWSKLNDNSTNEQLVHSAKEAVKTGVKEKIDRLLNLQKQIDDIQLDLENGTTIDYIVIGGKLQKITKEISVTDKAYLRNIIKGIQSEISKMQGDYAPTKIAETDSDGNDKLKDSDLKEFAKLLNK
jgi:hypothetical protein